MKPQKPIPPGWSRICSSIYYRDARKMIDWLCDAYGFEVMLLVEGDNGRVEHSELVFGDGLIMVGSEDAGAAPRFGVPKRSPAELAGANTQGLMVFVDDVDAHWTRARAAGARIVDEPKVHDYGDEHFVDRSYGALDPEGHLWWFTQRLRDAPKKP